MFAMARSRERTGPVSRERMDPEEAWRALSTRDRAFDGLFVYGVATTGVFCRPSCAARRPNRQNVRFFDTTEEAAAAGFRACRRCRPLEPASSATDDRIRRARAFLDTHADEPVTLRELASRLGVSTFHLQRTFKRSTGLTPKAYLMARRVERFKAGLKRGESVTTATYEAGYGSASRVYEQSDRVLGMTPASYRRGGAGARIRFTIVPCSLGRLLVAATDRGVCRVAFGDADAPLEAALRREFPAAEVVAGDRRFDRWMAAVVAGVEGKGPQADVPVDVRGTAFQQQVWQSLRKIPFGATRSYAGVARAIGRPKAVRAVASACAANPVAILVPCHRVVRSDGSAAGYRWGSERKARLLERERRTVD
jgi:AraC family transcriptional regulator of adaptative response/methylated-DNA-[protein]-cysteine methyltransferase